MPAVVDEMPLTRDHIQRIAERFGFAVLGFEPGPGTHADIVLQDEQSEQLVTIGLWPCSSEEDLKGTRQRRTAGRARNGFACRVAAGEGAWPLNQMVAT